MKKTRKRTMSHSQADFLPSCLASSCVAVPCSNAVMATFRNEMDVNGHCSKYHSYALQIAEIFPIVGKVSSGEVIPDVDMSIYKRFPEMSIHLHTESDPITDKFVSMMTHNPKLIQLSAVSMETLSLWLHVNLHDKTGERIGVVVYERNNNWGGYVRDRHYCGKRYGPEEGWSGFIADSNGYLVPSGASCVDVTFSSDCLDDHGWVHPFGGLKPVKAKLKSLFDHTAVVFHKQGDHLACEERYADLEIQLVRLPVETDEWKSPIVMLRDYLNKETRAILEPEMFDDVRVMVDIMPQRF